MLTGHSSTVKWLSRGASVRPERPLLDLGPLSTGVRSAYREVCRSDRCGWLEKAEVGEW